MIAVLKQSDRVSSITLTVTTSLLDKLYTIERPFLELEDLTLLSRDSMPLTQLFSVGAMPSSSPLN